MTCGVGHISGSYLALLRLWHRLAAAAQIQPLAWVPYAVSAALKKKKRQKNSLKNTEFVEDVHLT